MTEPRATASRDSPCDQPWCPGMAIHGSGSCVLHGGMEALLALARSGPLRLTAFRGLAVPASSIRMVLEAANDARQVVESIDLSGTKVTGQVSLVALTGLKTLRASDAEIEALRVARTVIGDLIFERMTITDGSFSMANTDVSGTFRLDGLRASGGVSIANLTAGSIQIRGLAAKNEVTFAEFASGGDVLLETCSAGTFMTIGAIEAHRLTIRDIKAGDDLVCRKATAQRITLTDFEARQTMAFEGLAAGEGFTLDRSSGHRVRIENVVSDLVSIASTTGVEVQMTRVTGKSLTSIENISAAGSFALKVTRGDSLSVVAVSVPGSILFEGLHHGTDCSLFDVTAVKGAVLRDVRADGLRLERWATIDGGLELSDLMSPNFVGEFIEASHLYINECECDAIRLSAKTPSVSVISSRFGQGRIALASSRIECADCTFDGPLHLGAMASRSLSSAGGNLAVVPSLEALERCDISGLELAGLDLTECRFSGSLGYSEMTITSECLWRRRSPRRFYSPRLVLNEEWTLRGWADPAVGQPSAEEIAAMYRGLGEAMEHSSNTGRKGDLSFGEMEMRRKYNSNGLERISLWLYWASSGYAQRPWRPLALIAVAVIASFVVIVAVGLQAVPATTYSVLSLHGNTSYVVLSKQGAAAKPSLMLTLAGTIFSTVRITPPTSLVAGLTSTGQSVLGILGIVGPFLLGLALLSIRGRIR